MPMRRPRIFYGWYILGIAMLGAVLSAGTSQVFFSIMLKPITDEFGWGRTALAGIITVGTLGNAVLSPFLGRLSDRYGPRAMMVWGVLITGVSYALMPVLAHLWQFYLVYGTGRMVAGPALIGLAPNTALAQWFRRMRGRAMGLLAMSIPLGNAVMLLLGQLLIDTSGWRTVFVLLAVGTLALVAPMAMVIRHRPEEMGLLPDGEKAPQAVEGSARSSRAREERSWTLGEAARTPALWLIAAAGCLATTANSGVTFHQVAYFTDMGIPTFAAVVSLTVFALTGAVAAIFWGYLTERVPEQRVMIAVMVLAAGANLYLLSVRSVSDALLFAVLFGLTSRGEGTLLNIILAQYYGRGSYGTISGFVQPFTMAGLAAGPLLASAIFDLTGTYSGIFLAYACLWVLGAGCMWLAKKPERVSRTAGEKKQNSPPTALPAEAPRTGRP
jgi:sugar phosphate permease